MTKILVIDDDPDLRETLIAMLEDEGHEVVVAHDGESGIAAYASHSPDLVITDIFMPNKNGIEAIKAILTIKSDAKIIAMSGHARRGKDFCLWAVKKIGVTDILPKPFEIDDLVSRVNLCLKDDRPSA
jgi:DNA-binding response OmpR family regulator